MRLKHVKRIEKENKGCLETIQQYDNIWIDKQKQMRNSWQNDMLEQRVMHWAFEHEVLGSILGLKKWKFFSVINCHCWIDKEFLSALWWSVNNLKQKPTQSSKDSLNCWKQVDFANWHVQ